MMAFNLDELPHSVAAVLPPSSRLEEPAQGKTSEVMIATSGNQSVVIKRCRNPVYLSWLQREQQNLRLLEAYDLPIPRLLHYCEQQRNERTEGWLVMTKIPGHSLWDKILEIPAPGRGPLMRKLGQLLRRLHSTPIPPAMRVKHNWIFRKLAEAENNLPWCDGSRRLLEQLKRAIPAAVPEVLIHGDMALDNVLIDDVGNLFLIDCSGADSGDPRCDITLALNSEPETTYAAEEIDSFCDGYGSPMIDSVTRRWFLDLYEFF